MHRRRIHEYIHSIKGNIRVYCRVKPTNNVEDKIIRYPEIGMLSNVDSNICSLELKNAKTNENLTFNFDRIFIEDTPQEEV
jgi:kinesin family protein C1